MPATPLLALLARHMPRTRGLQMQTRGDALRARRAACLRPVFALAALLVSPTGATVLLPSSLATTCAS